MTERNLIANCSNFYQSSFAKYTLKGFQYAKRDLAAIEDVIRDKRTSDAAKFSAILAILKTLKRFPERDHRRSTERADRIKELLGKDARTVTKYLDFGCGSGTISAEIAVGLGVSPSNAFGVDIIKPEAPPVEITFRQTIDGLGDGEFDLITAFVSFHHIANIGEIVERLKNLLKVGGSLIIREHDSSHWSGNEHSGYIPSFQQLPAFLNVIHHWSAYSQSVPEDPYTKYRRLEDWIAMMKDHDLQYVNKHVYDGTNPQRLFHARFRRAA